MTLFIEGPLYIKNISDILVSYRNEKIKVKVFAL